jgi:murein L,D-transpeptidase YcbB/YkuD
MRAKAELAVELANGIKIDPTMPPLSQGSSNSTMVRELQRLLNENGATPQLSVDGGFGPLTATALNQFKIKHGLPANGIADEATWKALRNENKGITTVEDEELKTIYNRVEQVPEWARPTIQLLIDNKILQGVNSAGDLALNDDLIRTMVLLDRVGQFNSLKK